MMISIRRSATVAAALAVLLSAAQPGHSGEAAGPLVQISADAYTSATDTAQHATEVEPSVFAFGATIVAAAQSGRFADPNGGSTNIAWATSTTSGLTWTHGELPGTTVAAGGPYDRVSDPVVTYDAKHAVWMIASLPIAGTDSPGVIVSRSLDGGRTWKNPVKISVQHGTDKDWIVCDNTSSSPYYGHCYATWDNYNQNNQIYMKTSTDGGLTWGPPKAVASANGGLGGTPVVQPNGTVIVPVNDGYELNLLSFRSTDGGATWSTATQVTPLEFAADPGSMRDAPLQTAGIDRQGKVYVIWSDCRFEAGCSTDCPPYGICDSVNDLVMTTTTDGLTWSPVTRLAIDKVGSGVDHLVPGLGVDPRTAGDRAHLALGYYYFPNANCSLDTCELDVTTVLSYNGGASWSRPVFLTNPMRVTWLANTDQGYMVGDYIATAFTENGLFHPVFDVAAPPTGTTYHEATYTLAGGL